MTRTILLADDSSTIRKIVELTFKDSAVQVEAVASGLEALEKLHELQPDLLLADVVMPEPAGYELCQQVKQSTRAIPVVLLTGAFEEFDAERARECGADDRLVKPFESQMLRDTVERLLDQSAIPEGVRQAALAPEDAQELEALSAEVEESRPGAAEPTPPEDFYEIATDWQFDESGQDLPVEVASEALAASDRPDTPYLPHRPDSRVPSSRLSAADIEAVADAVVRRLSGDVVRDLAREMLPDIATELVRQRIRELEDDDG